MSVFKDDQTTYTGNLTVLGNLSIGGTETVGGGTGSVNGVPIPFTTIANSLGADVLLNATGTTFDGPSIAQGTVGTWFASGQVTILDTVASTSFLVKLWDGTTVINSCYINNEGANAGCVASLSGIITNPAANIKISVRDANTITGKIVFNVSGFSKDSTITAIRIG